LAARGQQCGADFFGPLGGSWQERSKKKELKKKPRRKVEVQDLREYIHFL
jgi:hypothetical protein